MSRGAIRVSLRADGSIALLGSSSTGRLSPTLRVRWRRLNQGATRFAFVLADGRGDSIHIEAMGTADSLAEFVEILDDGVSAFHDGFLAGRSSGVHMIGGFRPSERQMASIVPRIVAFARCLQFHVNRYVTSWAVATPMWNGLARFRPEINTPPGLNPPSKVLGCEAPETSCPLAANRHS